MFRFSSFYLFRLDLFLQRLSSIVFPELDPYTGVHKRQLLNEEGWHSLSLNISRGCWTVVSTKDFTVWVKVITYVSSTSLERTTKFSTYLSYTTGQTWKLTYNFYHSKWGTYSTLFLRCFLCIIRLVRVCREDN